MWLECAGSLDEKGLGFGLSEGINAVFVLAPDVEGRAACRKDTQLRRPR